MLANNKQLALMKATHAAIDIKWPNCANAIVSTSEGAPGRPRPRSWCRQDERPRRVKDGDFLNRTASKLRQDS
jgi:hypothetical protein